MTASLLSVLLVVVGGGCDASVTSVGAWQPMLNQTEATGAQGGSGGSAGAGAGVGGTAAGSLAMAGEAGELNAAGAPELGPGLYLEAESAEFSSDPNVPDGGWAIIEDAAASGGKYILPPASLVSGDSMPGTALAKYNFNIEQEGDYLIWGRIYTPDITSNRFWFQVDGATWTVWRITVGTIWYWHALHNNMMYDSPMHFHFMPGAHELVIANNVPNARLDRLYVTSHDDEPPGNTTMCHPPHTVDLGGPMCELSCGVQAKPNMPTTCACDGRMDTFPAYDCTGKKCCFTMP
ncbi:MAG TPA: hypothetical protein VHB79_16290 [Polyangiaceae bacterium]|nr:hypothetical protein [Polyangiaceae bacterium]